MNAYYTVKKTHTEMAKQTRNLAKLRKQYQIISAKFDL